MLPLLPIFLILNVVAFAWARPSPKVPSVKDGSRWGRPSHLHRKRQSYTPTNEVNTTASTPSTIAPKLNIFAPLSNDEAAAVIAFLHNQTDLNLTAAADAGPWDNSIMVVDLLVPNKTDALAYLDGNATVPERWAYASLLFGATEEPYAQDWVIGPLGGQMGYWPNTFQTHTEAAKIRVYDMDSSSDFLANIAMNMSDVISDVLNATIETAKDLDETFDIWGIDPLWHERDDQGNDRVVYWAGFWRYPESIGDTPAPDAETLLPQGLYLRTDITGRDPSLWSLTGILYGDEFYDSIEDFRTATKQEGFERYTTNLPGAWTSTNQVGDVLPLEQKAPPQSIQPGGQRFEVDDAERWVKWMDFEFYITFTRDTGMKLFDVKFQGQRILYELGLQEAIAHYAGNDPVQSGTSYMDTYYGFGPYAFSQIPGYDMPGYAYCLNTTFHASELSVDHRCGITIFEQDQPYLMQRHSTSDYISATKNVALTVRSVSTVGNYDYNFDYIFYLDGSLETVVRASGYIQSAYYAKNGQYGYQIHDGLSGSMHDHALNFKADFDILGTSNTMVKHVIEPVDVQYKWATAPRSTMHMVRNEVCSEDEGRMNWSANAKEQVIIVNKDEPNQYGEQRGYKIMPSRGGAGMHLTIQNSSNLVNSMNFATHAYYLTQHKDSEPRAANAWNDYDPTCPLVDFGAFFDGENLVQEDLVLWYNLGMHHVPHTGDLPNTVFTTAQGGMFFTPHNYLFGDASRVVTQQIRIDYTADNVTYVETFGAEQPEGLVSFDKVSWDPYSYAGDVAVRKFPYDPQNPFNDTESIV